MKPINIQSYWVRSSIALSCFLLATSFTIRSAEKRLLTPEVSVDIVQENDGFNVSVKTTKNANIHFYLFTVDGRLSKELTIYGSKRINIPQLEKGIYIYDFFSNDERIKNGKIELR